MLRIVFSWIFGVLAMLLFFLIYQQKKRERLLLCKLLADISWVGHYLCLGALGGVVPNFIGIFRELIFLNRGKFKWADSKYLPIAFILLNWAVGIYTFKQPINIIPIAASTFVTVSLWFKNPKITKLITIPVCISFLIYDILVSSWIGVANESISIISILFYFTKDFINSIKTKGAEQK